MAQIAVAVATAAFQGSAFAAGGSTFAGVVSTALNVAQYAAIAVDALIIGPALFKQDNQEGARVQDIQLQGASEGDPIVRAYGYRVRVPGMLVWATPVQEFKDSQSGSSGKGGSGGAFITYKGYRSVAIQFMNTELSGMKGKGIERVVKVFADGKLFWSGDEEGARTISNTNIEAQIITSQNFSGTPTNYMILEDRTYNWPNIAVQPNGGSFGVGQDVEVSGFTGTAATKNNGTWRVVAAFPNTTKLQGSPYIQVYDPEDLSHVFEAKASGDQVTITQKNIATLLTAVPPEFQLGTDDQEPHRLLTQWENNAVTGVATDLCAMRGRVVMWLENLLLTDFGNRLPNFEALLEVNPEGEGTLADAMNQIATTQTEIPVDAVDTSEVTGSLAGYHSLGLVAPKKDLGPLMLGFHKAVRDTGTQLKFEDRLSLPEITIDADDDVFGVASVNQTERADTPIKAKDGEVKRLPRELLVTFANSEDDNQAGQRRAKWFDSSGVGVQEIALKTIAMSRDEAQTLGLTVLSLSRAGIRKYEGTLSLKYKGILREGMRVKAQNVLGRDELTFVIQRLEESAAGILNFQATKEDDESFTWLRWDVESTSLTGSSGTDNVEVSASYLQAVWHGLDLPPLLDEHRNQPGYYLTANSTDTQRSALGFIVYESTDGGSNYNHVTNIGREATIGYATTLPSSTGITEGLTDYATTLRIQLHDTAHQLYSVTEAEALAGHNLFLWGSEIISVATVTLVSEAVYDLSVMQRGLRDTGDEITGHAIGDRVIRLDGQGVNFIPLNAAALNVERYIKVVPNGGSLDAVTGFPLTVTGRNVCPFRPAQFHGVRDGSDNLDLDWQRSTRAIVQFDQPFPLDEEVEEYRLEFYDGSTLVRTEEVTTNSYQYTAADQATDGFTVPSDPITVRVMQRSKYLHWGRYREDTF